MFIYDPKRHYDKFGIRPAYRNPFKDAATLDVTSFKNMLSALFSSEAGVGRVFKHGDVLIIFDGRQQKASGYIAKELTRLLKTVTDMHLPQRKFVNIRLFHHNREFTNTGYAAPRCARTTLSALLPDPLENMYVVVSKFNNLPLRERKWLDIPGTNRARGISNLGLKPEEEQAINQIPVEVKRQILQHVSLNAMSQADGGGDDEGEDTTMGDDDDTPSQGTPDSQSIKGPVSLFPWEAPEVFWREIFHGYNTDIRSTLVVDFTPGSGTAAVAAARECVKYLGFVHVEAQKAVINETLSACIVKDVLLNRNDGFLTRRFLTRASSLGGTDAVSTVSSAMQVTELPPTGTPAKMGTSAKKSSSSSSSSDSD